MIHAAARSSSSPALPVGEGARQRGREGSPAAGSRARRSAGRRATPAGRGVITMPPPTPNRPESTPGDEADRDAERRPRAGSSRPVHHRAARPRDRAPRARRGRRRASARGRSGNQRTSSISSSRSVGVAARAPHQEEVHGLADAGVLPHVEVARVAERGLDLGGDAGLLEDLTDGGVLDATRRARCHLSPAPTRGRPGGSDARRARPRCRPRRDGRRRRRPRPRVAGPVSSSVRDRPSAFPFDDVPLSEPLPSGRLPATAAAGPVRRRRRRRLLARRSPLGGGLVGHRRES